MLVSLSPAWISTADLPLSCPVLHPLPAALHQSDLSGAPIFTLKNP